MPAMTAAPPEQSHVFLGAGHAHAERRTWLVIWLCGAMMALEIAGGALFGSLALIADGLHMSTHAGALLLAALAYSYARRHAADPRFSFGTGKLGDLAGFSSAIVLAMIALLIGYEAVLRLMAPVPIRFAEAIPIAVLGLGVNAASAWLLAGGGHHHHGHNHHGHAAEAPSIVTSRGMLTLEIFEDGQPPAFRLRAATGPLPEDASIETLRPDGARQRFTFTRRDTYLESAEQIPEPHEFTAVLSAGGVTHAVAFAEHGGDGHTHRDNNMRAAVVHVAADAAVSVLVIVGLLLARGFGWLWMDPLAGLVGAAVIASWSYGLVRDTGAILLDMSADTGVSDALRGLVRDAGDTLTDLHVWRLGPGHLGAILCVTTQADRDAAYYRERLRGTPCLSHLTVEVLRAG